MWYALVWKPEWKLFVGWWSGPITYQPCPVTLNDEGWRETWWLTFCERHHLRMGVQVSYAKTSTGYPSHELFYDSMIPCYGLRRLVRARFMRRMPFGTWKPLDDMTVTTVEA